jgi:anti-sigma factor RsiW
MMAYLDGELPSERAKAFEDHLAACDACREELERFRALEEELGQVDFADPSDEALEQYWACVYNRMERRTAWVLLWSGLSAVGLFLAAVFIGWVVRDRSVALVLRIALATAVVGLVILFVSLLRERWTVCKTDRYSRDVHR